MKKLLLLVVVTLCGTFVSNAQDEPKVQFGVRAGLNISSVGGDAGKSKEGGSLTKSLAGFHIGGIVDINVAQNFYIQPGLYITTKGGKGSDYDDYYDEKIEEKARPVYLQIPVLASYRINIADNAKWHINVGPYMAFGLGGKYKITWSDEDDSDSYDYKLFSKTKEDGEEMDTPLKRFDAGLSFGTGVSISKFYVGVNYDLGLTNIDNQDLKKDNNDKWTTKNRNFMVSVGYNF
ncbi:MAG: PorT family protein [Tannerellaceae bacterium]|nr:PorT family protein [Tannerellaceae bacterium]